MVILQTRTPWWATTRPDCRHMYEQIVYVHVHVHVRIHSIKEYNLRTKILAFDVGPPLENICDSTHHLH